MGLTLRADNAKWLVEPDFNPLIDRHRLRDARPDNAKQWSEKFFELYFELYDAGQLHRIKVVKRDSCSPRHRQAAWGPEDTMATGRSPNEGSPNRDRTRREAPFTRATPGFYRRTSLSRSDPAAKLEIGLILFYFPAARANFNRTFFDGSGA